LIKSINILAVFICLTYCQADNPNYMKYYPPEEYQPAAHMIASGAITGMSYYSLKYLTKDKKSSFIASILLSLGVGIWKETWDAEMNKFFNMKDMGYNGIGITTISFTIYLKDFL